VYGAFALMAEKTHRVVIDVDSGTPPHWQKHANSFTEWLESQVENFQLLSSCWFAAQAPALTDGALRLLRQHFDEGIQTYTWPGKTNYRFYNDRSNLLLWSNDNQCDWWVAPRSIELLAKALDEIEGVGNIGKHLYAIDERHESMLRAWR
jgi:hypothetical protein